MRTAPWTTLVKIALPELADSLCGLQPI